ncbi:hypothetical protein UFOVP315_45 [uncultured Caudovirales phage]|uniref:Uncharacterized protein n=1 Tax=uncultured Caudovirales phage TaxID=2100421 RepID=A0A6J5LTC7_9CAUD|nr:hypothetical protein UFOVP315_45 [uncultured Caudovirales phage]
MGFNPIKVLSPVAALFGMAQKPKNNTQPATPAPSQSADDVAREDERRRMLARGLTPLAMTGSMGDISTANLGRKALLGQ